MSAVPTKPTPKPSTVSISGSAVFATICLGILFLAIALTLYSTQMEHNLIDRALAGETVTIEEAEANDNEQLIADGVYLGAFVLSAIGVLTWIHKAVKNLDRAGPLGEYSPRLAVLYWFVPLLQLVKPYQVMAEIWQRTHGIGSFSKLIIPWWVTWLGANVLGWFEYFSRMDTVGSSSLESLVLIGRLGMVADVVLVVSGGLLLALIWRINAGQRKKGLG